MAEDHAFLRDALRRLDSPHSAPDAQSLRPIGLRLRDHVQMEERELFPYLEGALSAATLDQVGREIQASAERRR
jgi:hypothetical protein